MTAPFVSPSPATLLHCYASDLLMAERTCARHGLPDQAAALADIRSQLHAVADAAELGAPNLGAAVEAQAARLEGVRRACQGARVMWPGTAAGGVARDLRHLVPRL